MIGGIVAGLNHAMHKLDPPRKGSVEIQRKTLGNTREAVEHYFNGNGKDIELSWKVKFKLLISPESKRVIHLLVKGEAKLLSHNFRVNLTKGYDTFHIGRTRVNYSTSCTTTKCSTKFTAFSGDGFRDPLDIGQMTGGLINFEFKGGTPYNYIPWTYSIYYNNPGYPVGNNIKYR